MYFCCFFTTHDMFCRVVGLLSTWYILRTTSHLFGGGSSRLLAVQQAAKQAYLSVGAASGVPPLWYLVSWPSNVKMYQVPGMKYEVVRVVGWSLRNIKILRRSRSRRAPRLFMRYTSHQVPGARCMFGILGLGRFTLQQCAWYVPGTTWYHIIR